MAATFSVAKLNAMRKVSSNLYCELKSIIGFENVDIGNFQDEIIEQAKDYTDTTGSF